MNNEPELLIRIDKACHDTCCCGNCGLRVRRVRGGLKMTLTGDAAVLVIVGLAIGFLWLNATLARLEAWVDDNA